MTAKVKPVTLSSGVTVLIPKFSISALMLDLVRVYPKPQPPTQVVNLGGHESIEVNYAHPGYEKAVKEWEQDLQGAKATEQVLRLIASVNTLTDEQKEQVKARREELDEALNRQNDKMIWLRYIAVESDDDLTKLMQAARSGGEPSPEGVETIAGGFRGNG